MRAIAERHGLAPEPLRLFESGSDIVFDLGAAIVKLTAPRWRAQMANELEWLRWLEGRLELPAPRLIASGELEGWPYQISSRVDGRPLAHVWPTLDRDARLLLARDIGRAMRAFHDVPLDGAPFPGDWPQFLAERRRGVVAHQRARGASEPWLAEIEAFLDRTDRPERPLVALHTELLGEHIFVAEVDGVWRVSGLIDVADARIGHPDYEIAALAEFVFRGEQGLLGACLEAYGWPAADLARQMAPRLTAWALLHLFASLPRALDAVEPASPASLDELARQLYDPTPPQTSLSAPSTRD